MKFTRPITRIFAILAALFLLGSALRGAPVHIVLVGDSTVTDNAGWGLGFKQFLADGATLTNTSRGGRSSMSFIKEGSWEKALALKGDYYLIQFGHNDEPGKLGRSTTEEEYRAYMERYVAEARAAGAIPVLVTSLVRRQFKDPADPHTITSSLSSRAEIVRAIAREKNVPLVELHDRSKALCEKLGKDGCLAFSPPKEKGQFDGTHLNVEGYVMFGALVADELRRAVPALAPLILNAPRDAKPVATDSKYAAVVAFDGSGTHLTVQAAIDAAPGTATAARPYRILVKSGVYKEHIIVPADKPFITLLGEAGDTAATVITMNTNLKTPAPGGTDGKFLSASESATVLVIAPDFTAENITFENTTTREDKVQALAFYVTGDRAALRRCRFLGWQDTLRADAKKGAPARQYFSDCYIEGHVDFIYAAGTAVFDHCHIHGKADGYLTAASTPETTPYGYVFLDCKITTGADVVKGVFLGRPWRPFAATAFLRCDIQGNIQAEGWHNWGKETNEHTARYAEYKNTGPGADPTKRIPWARQLTDAEAADYTVKNILGGNDGWNPAR
jgi:pectinesterase